MSQIDLVCSITLPVQQAVLYSVSKVVSNSTRTRGSDHDGILTEIQTLPKCRIMPALGNQQNLVTHVQFSEILKITSYGNLLLLFLSVTLNSLDSSGCWVAGNRWKPNPEMFIHDQCYHSFWGTRVGMQDHVEIHALALWLLISIFEASLRVRVVCFNFQVLNLRV